MQKDKKSLKFLTEIVYIYISLLKILKLRSILKQKLEFCEKIYDKINLVDFIDIY